MEDIPPSYQQTMNPSVLDLIAPYVDTRSLHALTLVSRHYNAIFMSYLWGSPASHFVPLAGSGPQGAPDQPLAGGPFNDLVYVALTRFKRVLRKARLSTRCLVHTLYLPPAVSEIYGGPNATWLREILDGLPNLQSLCVSGLPFFDHHSLVAVDRRRAAANPVDFQTYPLKLLLAAKESNVTSIGLSLYLPHTTGLIYLDLSYTTPARDVNVLSALAAFRDLQVLKLRGIGLRDNEGQILIQAIGLTVRLLDVSENLLTDNFVTNLLSLCLADPTGGSSNGATAAYRNATRQLESWPVSLPPAPDFLSLDILRSSDLDRNLLVQLTNPLTGRLAFEDIPHNGITHLYITENQGITVEGTRKLLDNGRLHVLDAGEVAGSLVSKIQPKKELGLRTLHIRNGSIGSRSDVSTSDDHNRNNDKDPQFIGAEHLIPTLQQRASKNLTFLRIDHAIMTKEHEIKAKVSSAAEVAASEPKPAVELNAVAGDAQLVEISGSNHHAVEAPSEQIFEMDATPVFRAELPGDIIHFAISPAVGDSPAIVESDIFQAPIRGEGAYAPEVVVENGIENANSSEPGSSGAARAAAQREQPQTTASGTVLETAIPLTKPISNERQNLLDSLTRLRPKQPSSVLYPSHIPNLRTLVLTNVPSQVPAESTILKSLKAFITACAAEAHIALLQAKTDYSLPPGRARIAAEQKHARSIFALTTIVLEVVPIVPKADVQRGWKHARQRLSQSKSSTGDKDSEALWTASENDFSFFGEEGEEHDECGIYDHEPERYFPRVSMDDAFSLTDDMSISSNSMSGWNGNSGSFPDGSNGFTMPNSRPTSTIGNMTFRSPRELPLGRNRRSSSNNGTLSAFDRPPTSMPFRPGIAEMQGTVPTAFGPPARANTAAPTSAPRGPDPSPMSASTAAMLDTVSELSTFRKSRRALYEDEFLRVHDRRRQQRLTLSNSTAQPVSNVSSPQTQPQRPYLVSSHSTSHAIPTPNQPDPEVYIEGHWHGTVKVVRLNNPTPSSKTGEAGSNASSSTTGGRAAEKGRLERRGMVDVYGNYFEGGYLYS